MPNQPSNYLQAYSKAFITFLTRQKLTLRSYYHDCNLLIPLFQANLHWFSLWGQLPKATLQSFLQKFLVPHVQAGWEPFLAILIQDGQLRFLLPIVKQIAKRLLRKLQITRGTVYSVIPLDQPRLKKLTGALERRLNQEVELTNQLDRQLLGGILVEIGAYHFDNSLLKQLKNLSSQLLQSV